MSAKLGSISDRQSAVLNGGFLDLLGSNYGSSDVVSFENVTDTLIYLAALYQQSAMDRLDKLEKVSSGFLSDSIKVSDVIVMGSSYIVEISIADYYIFVDRGVNGWNQSRGSQFSFKNYTGRSGKKSSQMVTAIQAWVKKQGLQGNVGRIKNTISRREKMQRSIGDPTLSTAIAITKSIRKNGLAPTHFWTDTEAEIAAKAEGLFGTALKIDIINQLYGTSN
jgi:hypothetical protein